jgi:putative cell wall-binding protein/protocatechuate 3,4-dioxygenase beta subunit
MPRRLPALITSLLVAISASILGVAPAAMASTATISGTILSAEDNSPLEGVDVTLYLIDEWGAGYLTQTQTNASGEYGFSALEAGPYAIRADASLAVGLYASQWYLGVTNEYEATTIFVDAPDESVSLATMRLEPAGTISGTVVDEGGLPIESVYVSASLDTGESYISAGANTDANGAYTVGPLPAGDYVLRFEVYADASRNFVSEYYNDTLDFGSATPVTIEPGVAAGGFDAELAAGATISGTVVGSDAPTTGLEDVWVSANANSNGAYTSTDANGDYTLYGLPVGDVIVDFSPSGGPYLQQWWQNASTFDAASPVTIATPGETISGINGSLQRGASIAGTVTDPDGLPLAFVQVRAEPQDFNNPFGSAETDINGEYLIEGVNGDYLINFGSPNEQLRGQFYNDVDTRALATTVSAVAPQLVSNIDAQLRVASSISGTVTDGVVPLEDIGVDAYSQQLDAFHYTETDANGEYTLGGLAPASDWRVSFYDNANGLYAIEFYNNAPVFQDADPITLAENQQLTGIDASLELLGSISGTVTDTGGAPLAGIDVAALPGGDFDYQQGSSPTVTDEFGAYELRGVRPGDALVLAGDAYRWYDDPEDGYRSAWFDNAFDPGLATDVPVVSGAASTGIDFVLPEVIEPDLHSPPTLTNATPGSPEPLITIGAPASGPGIYGYTVGVNYGGEGDGGILSPAQPAEIDFSNGWWSGEGGNQVLVTAAAIGPDGTGAGVRELVELGTGPGYAVTPEVELMGATSTSLSLAWDIPSGDGVEWWAFQLYEVGGVGNGYFDFYDGDSMLYGSAGIGDLEPGTNYEIFVIGGQDSPPYDRTFWGTLQAQTLEASDPDLKVTVTNGATGQLFADANVSILDFTAEPFFEQYGVTDANGLYETELEPGTYQVSVEAFEFSRESFEVVVTGNALNEIEATLYPANSSISGTVLDDQGAVIACEFDEELQFGNCPRVSATIPGENNYFSVEVSEVDGTYTLDGLWEGEWEVSVSADGYVTPDPTLVVLGRDDARTGVDFALEPIVYGTVSGTVRDTGGDPIEGIFVDVVTVDPFVGAGGATTGADGTYSILVPVGVGYTARAIDDFAPEGVPRSPSYETVFYGGQWNVNEATTFEVLESTDTSNIDFDLAVGGAVAGQLEIITSNGTVNRTPDSWPGPTLFREYEGEWVEFDNGSPFAGSGPLGSFERDGLPAGEYRVAFLPSFSGPRAFTPVYYDGASSVETATSVTVNAGGTVTVNETIAYPRPDGSPQPVGASNLDAGLEDGIGVAGELEQGETTEVMVGEQFSGEWVSAWAYSDPTGLGDEWVQVDSSGAVEVPIPAGLPVGPHSIAVQLADDELVGWSEVTVTEASTGPNDPEVARLSGANRFATAVNIAKQYEPFAEGEGVVYIANGLDYPDALSAAPAAAYRGAPLLLTERNSLPGIVADEIERLSPETIIVVGGAAVVSARVYDELSELAPEIERHSGSNRYETSRIITERAFGAAGAEYAYIATGLGFADALAASAAAGVFEAPVILVDGTARSVDDATVDLLDDLGTTTVKIAGGTAVVSTGIKNSLDDVSFLTTVQRLAGSDRFTTSQIINDDAFDTADTVYLATGFGYADALAGAALAGLERAPLFVVPGTCVPRGVLTLIDEFGATDVVLLGGTAVLSSRVAALRAC